MLSPTTSIARTYHHYSLLYIPLLGVITGIYLTFKFPAMLYAAILLLIVMCAYIFLNNKFNLPHLPFAKQVCVLFIGFSIGCGLLFWQRATFEKKRTYLAGKTWDIVGTITDQTSSSATHFGSTTRILLKRIKNNTTKEWQTQHGDLLCYTAKPIYCNVGDLILMRRVPITPIATQTSLENRSFEDYLCKEGISATAFIHKPFIKKLRHPYFSLSRWIAHFRNYCAQQLKNQLSQSTQLLFETIFLGSKNRTESQTLQRQSTIWGISHYLARSGLHLILVVCVWGFFLSWIPLPFRLKQGIMIFLCLVYAVLTWQSISFTRALLVFLALRVGSLLDYQKSFLHLLCLACLGILCYNPMQLFFLDFQLSFALTFALGWYAELERSIEFSSPSPQTKRKHYDVIQVHNAG